MSQKKSSLLKNRGRLRRDRVSDIYPNLRQRNRQRWKVSAALSFVCISYGAFEDSQSLHTIRPYGMERGRLVELGRGRWVIISGREEGVGL